MRPNRIGRWEEYSSLRLGHISGSPQPFLIDTTDPASQSPTTDPGRRAGLRTKPISTSPLSVASCIPPTSLFLSGRGVTHIRHDEPLSPAGSIRTPGRETSVTLPAPRADLPSQTQHHGIHPRQSPARAVVLGLGLETQPGGQPRRPSSARPDRRGPRAGEGATSADPRALQPGATCPGVPAVQSPLGSRLSSCCHMTRDLRGAPGRTSYNLVPAIRKFRGVVAETAPARCAAPIAARLAPEAPSPSFSPITPTVEDVSVRSMHTFSINPFP